MKNKIKLLMILIITIGLLIVVFLLPYYKETQTLNQQAFIIAKKVTSELRGYEYESTFKDNDLNVLDKKTKERLNGIILETINQSKKEIKTNISRSKDCVAVQNKIVVCLNMEEGEHIKEIKVVIYKDNVKSEHKEKMVSNHSMDYYEEKKWFKKSIDKSKETFGQWIN